jgi:hypothetical protein
MGEGSSAAAYHIDKSRPGEGAGYLMNVISIINTGGVMPIRTYADDTSLYKEITAALRSGDPVIGIDNIPQGTIVRSGPFAGVLTAGRWKARIFGSNTTEVDIPTLAMWVLAGNNFGFSGELAQRMVPIRLDSALPDPAKARADNAAMYFKCHPQVLADYVKARRAEIVWGLHTLTGRWFADGKPAASVVHPRYPEYSAVVGGILENAARIAGVACGFLTNLEAYRQNADDGDNVGQAWMQLCFDVYKDSPMTAADMVQAARNPVSGELQVEIPIELDRDGRMRNPQRASAWIRGEIQRATFTLVAPAGETRMRLTQVRKRSPVTYRLSPVRDE